MESMLTLRESMEKETAGSLFDSEVIEEVVDRIIAIKFQVPPDKDPLPGSIPVAHVQRSIYHPLDKDGKAVMNMIHVFMKIDVDNGALAKTIPILWSHLRFSRFPVDVLLCGLETGVNELRNAFRIVQEGESK